MNTITKHEVVRVIADNAYSRPTSNLKLTEAEIEAGRSAAGGWNARTLRAWGVPWPPPRGWRWALLNGQPIPTRAARSQQIFNPQSRAVRQLAADLGVDPDQLRAALLALIEARSSCDAGGAHD